jgi:hypothetical protein
LTGLILASATVATSSTELLGRYVAETEALDCTKEEVADALAVARTVARTAAAKLEAAAARLGFSLKSSARCPDDAAAVTDERPVAAGCGCEATEPAASAACGCETVEPASASCGCNKGTNCP